MLLRIRTISLIVLLGPVSAIASGLGTQAISAVNQARLKGAPCSGAVHRKVRWSPKLYRAALEHSRAMAAEGKINHSGFSRRLRSAGIPGRGAENVAMGYRMASPRKVVKLWLGSPGHCRNLMNDRYTLIGMARVKKGRVDYWTLILGEE